MIIYSIVVTIIAVVLFVINRIYRAIIRENANYTSFLTSVIHSLIQHTYELFSYDSTSLIVENALKQVFNAFGSDMPQDYAKNFAEQIIDVWTNQEKD